MGTQAWGRLWRSLLVGACLLALACSQPEPIRVGFMGGLTGSTADLGTAARNAVMLALDQANKDGGIQGRSLELISWDDQQNPDRARQGIDQLAVQQVVAVVGPMTSAMAMAIQPAITAKNMLVISPTVSTEDLTGKDDNFLRVISSTSTYAVRTAVYQAQKLKHRRLAAIYDLNNKSYSQSWLRDFTKAFELHGGAVVKTVSFDASKQPDFQPLVKELLAVHPDGLVIIASGEYSGRICKAVRQMDRELPLAISEWGATGKLMEVGGADVEGVIVAQFLDRGDTTPKYQDFLKQYQQRFGQDPGFAGVTGYDAANVLITALRHDSDPKRLRQTILGIAQFSGVQQDIHLNPFGDADRVTFMTKIQHGKYVTLE